MLWLWLLLTFIISFIFAPYSLGLIFLLLFTLIYEGCYWGWLYWKDTQWCWDERALLVVASIAGWVLGRWIFKKPLHIGIERECLEKDHCRPWIDKIKNFFGR